MDTERERYEKALTRELGAIQLQCDRPVCSCEEVPDRREVILLLKDLQTLMFPGYFRPSGSRGGVEGVAPGQAVERLARLIALSLPFGSREDLPAPVRLAEDLIHLLPDIKRRLVGDAQAIYEGDPAARSPEEVVICYPGFYAICVHRVAHELYRLGVPLLPRIMSEYAHEKTGIDIHPGAQVGERFCIDHGTGIVIGETARIGHDVKLYQGVTLGARSFALDENGMPVKGTQRHPQIGDRVVIYANAVILGGDTRVGDGCVIGGNVWLTASVPDGQTVYYDGDGMRVRQG